MHSFIYFSKPFSGPDWSLCWADSLPQALCLTSPFNIKLDNSTVHYWILTLHTAYM